MPQPKDPGLAAWAAGRTNSPLALVTQYLELAALCSLSCHFWAAARGAHPLQPGGNARAARRRGRASKRAARAPAAAAPRPARAQAAGGTPRGPPTAHHARARAAGGRGPRGYQGGGLPLRGFTRAAREQRRRGCSGQGAGGFLRFRAPVCLGPHMARTALWGVLADPGWA